MEASFKEDLAKLQSDQVLQDTAPAYILAKLDLPSQDWITLFYVPDGAQVRDKVGSKHVFVDNVRKISPLDAIRLH